jgi:demethylmenaquinone methyltransferase/2-methoxy-6-polyprenyl-1,4-benzoquinol methylase
VANTFARISKRYDRLNTVMTAGRHYAWRRMAAGLAVGRMSGPALDVASGTGDFTFELAGRPAVTSVVGLDFSREMLLIAGQKARRKRLSGRVSYLVGDAHDLPFSDGRFVCATVGFGIRNFIDVPGALRSISRVVAPGGRVVILEIVRLEGRGPLGRLFPLYFRYVTPLLGALLAGDREAYTYLPESVQRFLSARELASMLEDAGFERVAVRVLALGAVAIVSGEKPM